MTLYSECSAELSSDPCSLAAEKSQRKRSSSYAHAVLSYIGSDQQDLLLLGLKLTRVADFFIGQVGASKDQYKKQWRMFSVCVDYEYKKFSAWYQ